MSVKALHRRRPHESKAQHGSMHAKLKVVPGSCSSYDGMQLGATSKQMMFWRLVWARATLMALSTASEPLLAKKNRDRLGGTIFSSLSSRPTCKQGMSPESLMESRCFLLHMIEGKLLTIVAPE